MSITFGLTGGICCGKSTITKTFRSHNIPIVDGDMVARQVVEPGNKGLFQIVEKFGTQYLQSDGTIDRAKMGAAVFANATMLQTLNQIMMPLIHEETQRQLNNLHDQGYPIVGFDAALIIEMGHKDLYRPLIVAHCPPELQLERLMKRGVGNGALTRQEAMDRMAAQLPTEEKVKVADFIIDTSKEVEHSVSQTLEVIEQLKKMI